LSPRADRQRDVTVADDLQRAKQAEVHCWRPP
jgi:hypothetical protein